MAVRYLGEPAGKAYSRDTADMEFVAIHVRPHQVDDGRIRDQLGEQK